VVRALAAEFTPQEISTEAIAPFTAIEFVHGDHYPRSAALAQFTLNGPETESARNIDAKIRHVAYDHENDRCFALTTHDFGTITPSSGRFTKIEVDSSLGDFSWPKGLALNTKENKVIIMTSHVYTRFYVYDPRASDWEQLPSEIRDLPLSSLAYSPDDNSLYALEDETRSRSLNRIHRFNTQGASLGSAVLQPAIPMASRTESPLQLHWSSKMLVLLLPPFDSDEGIPAQPALTGTGNRLLAVEPATGTVFVPQSTASAEVISPEEL
jgi:DNA-binding beta-propeller fold protein YncE